MALADLRIQARDFNKYLEDSAGDIAVRVGGSAEINAYLDELLALDPIAMLHLSILEHIEKELKIMNMHLALMTDTIIDKEEIE